MIVRDNKSQALLQVKAKEEFPHALRSAVIHFTTNDAEGILIAERNDGFSRMTGLAQRDGAKHRALTL
jgi:hypothetical protein